MDNKKTINTPRFSKDGKPLFKEQKDLTYFTLSESVGGGEHMDRILKEINKNPKYRITDLGIDHI